MSKIVMFSDEDFFDIISLLNLYKHFYEVVEKILSPEELKPYRDMENRITQISKNIKYESLDSIATMLKSAFNEGYRQGELRGVEDIVSLRNFNQDNSTPITIHFNKKKVDKRK